MGTRMSLVQNYTSNMAIRTGLQGELLPFLESAITVLAVMILPLRELVLVTCSSTSDGQLLQKFKGQFPKATLKT